MLPLPRKSRFPHSGTLPVDQVLVLGPLLIVASGLAHCCPFLLVLPLGVKNNAPKHYEESIQKVSRTVLSRKLEKRVVEESHQPYNRGEDEPGLQESHKGEVGLRVGAEILLHIADYHRPVLGIFVDGNEFLESCVAHDITEGVYLVTLLRSVLLLHEVSQQVVVLGPQLLIRSEQRLVFGVVCLLVGQVLLYFIFVKDRVLLLHVNLLVYGFQTSPDPFEVVAQMDVFPLLGQVDLLVDGLQVKPERFLGFSLQDLQLLGLFGHHVIRYFKQHQNLLLFFMRNDPELRSFCHRFHRLLEVALHLLPVPLFKNHDEVPPLNDFFRLTRKPFLDQVLIAFPNWLSFGHHTFNN